MKKCQRHHDRYLVTLAWINAAGDPDELPAAAGSAARKKAYNSTSALRVPFGNSNTRHVVVACAISRPFASVIRASAVATRRPALSTRPSVRTTPLVALMPRTNEILNSSVV